MEKVKISKKSYLNFNSEKRTIIQKIIAAGVLTLAFIFSLNSYGGANTFDCSSETNTLEHYNKVLEAQKNNLTPTVRYDLGFTAICIGMYEDGLRHMREASKGGHVAATKILGSYYSENQSFDDVKTASMENTYTAITHFEKAANQIESASSYPEGVTEGMEYIEYASMTSYRVFTILPALHFNIHVKIMKDITKNGTFYPNTLEVLQKIGDAATRCLRRPALSVWAEKKERVYKTQQIECQAYLDFVEAIYPLESERLQITDSCTVSVNQCEQHKHQIRQMIQVTRTLFRELKKSPGLAVAKRS